MKSIEEQIEDIAKRQLNAAKIKYYTKNESINTEIQNALKKAESKSGGNGGNRPDIQLFIQTADFTMLPVMIEVKGTKGCLIKQDESGDILNRTPKGEPDYSVIKKYAVNGAVHYAEAIINHSSYKQVIAVGINGYDSGNGIKTELGVYYISQENSLIPKKIFDWSDLSFLTDVENLYAKIKELSLTEAEIERKSRDFENQIETILKNLNQTMHDTLNIKDTERVQFVCGMIMAALGVEQKVIPLSLDELRGQLGPNSHDGAQVIGKIKDFLNEKKLPKEKIDIINAQFLQIFCNENNYKPINDESPIKRVYKVIADDIMPIFRSAKHLDFTGRLFNVLNSWISNSMRPGDDKNDVVLTPRYVCELMAKLCKVNKDSYVWDYTAGSGGFLVSAMKLMIQDAQKSIKSEEEKNIKISNIKMNQLLGIELRPDIYMLAVLNMILMEDGSSHILNKDCMDYSGKYEQGENLDKDFPADVFLLNPPYSARGKGFIFVERALSKMKKGRAAVLIQENAGSGKNGLPYTQNILGHNSLLASIHMSDIFCGKAGVQTAIYLFEVGIPHDKEALVKFIDFSNDGYTRMNRKKSSANINLRNTDHALERYDEIVDIVLNRQKKTHYYDDLTIEDTITLNGNDWTFSKHNKVDTMPAEADFRKTISDFLSCKISTIIKYAEDNPNFP